MFLQRMYSSSFSQTIFFQIELLTALFPPNSFFLLILRRDLGVASDPLPRLVPSWCRSGPYIDSTDPPDSPAQPGCLDRCGDRSSRILSTSLSDPSSDEESTGCRRL